MGRLLIAFAALITASIICGGCESDRETSAPTARRMPRPAAAPTNTPRPRATPAASFTVDCDVINVRSGPGTNYAILGSVQRGQTCQPTGRNPVGDWLTFDFNGQSGWIYASLLLVTRADAIPVAAIPIAAAPQTAAPTQPSALSDEGGFLSGSCTALKEQGLVPFGGWPRGHVN